MPSIASHARQFRRHVVDVVCDHLAQVRPALGSEAARRLLIGTAVYESGLQALEQDRGPARSYFQIEPPTARDVTAPRGRNGDLLAAINDFRPPVPVELMAQITANPLFACAVARLVYWRAPAPLPAADDLVALGQYYKKYYNTDHGKGTAVGWTRSYRKYCGDGK
ncbi:conserved hypothetical protein [Candidatus Defluviicoccus seviourii]|uniref:Transglycosylase SLT domain-containing protein n=1 Tax=Candidatus Defluviicoccus seviourii TaxID=2565273 RepID=A0A564WJQ4_9PROT|nr:conserved hypothetical protein [Candidatus Defluviicoccus seviourii]